MPAKKRNDLMRRRMDMDANMIARFETGVKNLETVNSQFSDIVKAARLAFDHEIVLNGPQGNDGMVCDMVNLKDTVNGNEQKGIVGLGAQLRALQEKLKYYWNAGRVYVLAMSFLVLALVAFHMVEVGKWLENIHP